LNGLIFQSCDVSLHGRSDSYIIARTQQNQKGYCMVLIFQSCDVSLHPFPFSSSSENTVLIRAYIYIYIYIYIYHQVFTVICSCFHSVIIHFKVKFKNHYIMCIGIIDVGTKIYIRHCPI
jgi:hypothetical protein